MTDLRTRQPHTAAPTAAAATPERCLQASLMVDGARLPLSTVAEVMALPVDRLARYVALGRLHAADDLVVLPKGCGPHLGGLVTGSAATTLHVMGCAHCQQLELSMAAGIRAARVRWTGPRTTVLSPTPTVPRPPAVGPRAVPVVPPPPIPHASMSATVPPASTVSGEHLRVMPFTWSGTSTPSPASTSSRTRATRPVRTGWRWPTPLQRLRSR